MNMELRLALRRLVLLGTPLAFAILEIFHPHAQRRRRGRRARGVVHVVPYHPGSPDRAHHSGRLPAHRRSGREGGDE